MSRELARLVERHGGEPINVPAVRESARLSPEGASRVIDDMCAGRYDVVIFMTGVAVSLLFETADRIGRRPDLVNGLRGLTTVCRGPKPTAALRGFGVPPTLTAEEQYTSAEVLDALSSFDIEGKRVLLLHYGERSETLAETLLARGAVLEELWLYRWLMPEDTRPLEQLVERIISGDVDALAITCQIQFRHLMDVATRTGLDRSLVDALRRVVVAAVGPTCTAVLHAYGVDVDVIPNTPKMGPLIVSLMRTLERRARPSETSRHPSREAVAP